jgi:hypothetical protein
MKKKFIYGLFVLVALLTVVGCTKEKKEKKEEVETRTLTYTDNKTGYTTEFNYKDGQGYEITDYDNDGKYTEITIKNHKLNFEVEIYYTDVYSGGFEKAKDNRKESDGFKEYTWGKYKGYRYDVDDDDLYFDILLEEGERDISLFGSFEVEDEKNVLEAFDSESFQSFLSSMKFKK